MTWRLESPKERKPLRFTKSEADRFLQSWWRITEPDGSTVAYVVDRATGKLILDAVRRHGVGRETRAD